MTHELTIEETPDGTLYRAIHDVFVDWSDQTGWFDPDKVIVPVTIVGCGGIGSNAAFELITMGFRCFVLYDDDKVEPRNLASQKAYRYRDLYRRKAEALAEILIEYGAIEVLVRDRRFTADDVIDSSIVIGAVDSMASRQMIWDAIQNSPDVEIYLDGRLDGEVAQIFAVEPLDADWYTEDWLFTDVEASQGGTCTMRTIVYPATVMAGVMCRHLTRWSRNLPVCRFLAIDMATLAVTEGGNIEEE
jgi:hypothetical protein